MRILITGAAGFLGGKLVRSLIERPISGGADELILVDRVAPEVPAGRTGGARARAVTGGLDDAAALIRADGGIGAIVHLAAVVSAGAEADFDLGYRVNLDGTRALLEACRSLGTPPRFLFASSVAVFGGALPPVVDDTTWPRPQSSYGTQKLIGEMLVADYSRKDMVDGLSLRLPTVVVRPGRPNKAASGFASSLFREPLQGETTVCPVDPSTGMWVLSPRRAVAGLRHALDLLGRGHAGPRSVNLPGITVSVAEMIEALRRAGGDSAVARVRFERDESVERIVASWPARFETRHARDLGFEADPGIDAIVEAFLADDRTPSSN